MKHIQSIARSILMRFDGILSSNIRDIRSDTSSWVLCSKFLDWLDIDNAFSFSKFGLQRSEASSSPDERHLNRKQPLTDAAPSPVALPSEFDAPFRAARHVESTSRQEQTYGRSRRTAGADAALSSSLTVNLPRARNAYWWTVALIRRPRSYSI